ncbi:MAG TPA: bifunctional 5,10-methylenetetrahydrofolate dehydrogenase/5,10-methenyltetrahydrofolate cyclohydrolase [Mogibacterium sp.]|nr:bifunctional 5,10-methylenetetrahydrofolate dehydrogenase/5,10-methenyltetrahydrofolate cyclohydrolase [Mogibacterium sp.]
MAEILKGAPVANALTDKLIERVNSLKAKGVAPNLALVRVGERGDDLAYERGLMKRCEKIGVKVENFVLPADCRQEELLDTIRKINEDDGIHGCLMFRPLRNKEDEQAACALLSPEKDVDCITTGSLAAVFTGSGAGFPPCTAQACMEILDYYGYNLQGKRVTVIGRSLVIGKPLSMMLQGKNATVTMCHTKTVDLPGTCRNAEILIVAAGKANVVDETYTNPNQVVIDVGINVDSEGKLCGDVKFDSVESEVAAVTPVPGGVGTVTSTVLAKHVIDAAEKTL